nr:uncharacterized protein LOC117979556 [Pan paniscus]
MASPSGSSEATGKPRGRDGPPRREEDDVPPEEKRLRLLLEGEAHSPRTARTGRTRRGRAGRRPAPRQVATAEERNSPRVFGSLGFPTSSKSCKTQDAGRAPGAMTSPSGSSEATGKPRGRDGRPRREENDVPSEEKRLRLWLEEGRAQPEDCEDGEDAPRPGREETGTQTGGDGRGLQGNKAASFHYSKGGAKYEGEAVKRSLVESYTHPNSNETEWRENIDTVMNWFTKEDFDFVTLCYREPDNVGHRFGPEGENRKLMIQQIDRTIGYLVGAKEKHSLQSTSASSSHETMR